jgi:transposase
LLSQQVARRYDVNANQVFNWLKDPAFAASEQEEDAPQFLPVEVAGPVQPPPISACEHGETRIKLPNGLRVKISGFYDPEALAVLIRMLSA